MVEFSRLVDAVIGQESGGRVDAVSGKGALGLMQLMPSTAREVAGKLGLPFDAKRLTTDAKYNKLLGSEYLKSQLEAYDGNDTLALAAYNAGPGKVKEWLAEYGDPRTGSISDEAWAEKLPFKETRNYVKKIKGRMGESSSPLPQPPTSDGPVQMGDLHSNAPITRDQQAAFEHAQQSNAPGVVEAASLALQQEWGFTWAMNSKSFAPDPNWAPDEQYLQTNLQDIPKEHWDYVAGGSVSEADFNYRKEFLKSDLEAQKRLAQAGWTGTALRLGAAVIDPVALGIGVATDGIAAPFVVGMKASRLGRILATGGAAAVGNTASELIPYNYKPTSTGLDLLYAAGGGFALGGAIGALRRNPHTQAEADRLMTTGRELADAAVGEQASRHLGHAGAMEASWKEPLRNDTLGLLQDLTPEAAPFTAFGQTRAKHLVRTDSVGQLKSSENPLARALGGHMAEDGVGNADKRVASVYSASEWGERNRRVFETEYAQELQASFGDYAKRNKVPAFKMAQERMHFEEEVSRFIRNTDPTKTFDPAVQRLGRKVTELQGRILQLANNPGATEGKLMRPVQGFGDLHNGDNYLMRQYNTRAVQEAAEKYGDKNMRQYLKQAVLSRVPDMEEKLAEKYAKGMWTTLRKMHWGMEAKVQNAFAGRDIDFLKELLTDAGGLSADEIEDIAKILKPKADGAQTRAKHRMDIDENFEAPIMRADGLASDVVRFDQLLENNVTHLFQAYNRQLTGAAALARIQIPNPKAPGEYLLNGIASKADFEAAKNQLKAIAEEIGQSKVSLERDLANLDFLYNSIAGIPHDAAKTPAAQLLRMVQKYNFIRVMNQVGFAQIAEIGNITGQLGIKAALSNMPGFKALWRNAKTGKIDDALSRELEGVFGIGSDWLRGSAHQRWDELGTGPLMSESPLLTKIDNVLDRGTRITTAISGMSSINTLLHRWSMRGIVQKFSDLALEPSTANKARMATLGLDEKMLDRVLKQVDKHFTREDGLWAKKVTRLNLDNWDDVPAREAFKNAADRWAKRIIQENDVGTMHRWMSHPVAKIIMQFRTFMMNAFAKQTLHNIKMMDRETFASFAGSMLWGSIAYTMQTYAQSIGRSDREKFLEKRLSISELGKAAFQRAGMSSVAPMLIDSGARFTGFDPFFDARTTGLPSNAIWGNPTIDLIFDRTNALAGGVHGLLSDRPVSQREYRDMNSVLPFMNFLPWQAAFNTMISNNPEMEPRN